MSWNVFSDRSMVFIMLLAGGLLLLVLEMVRRRAIAERYSLLWLFAALGILVLALLRPVLDQLALLIGISYPPSALFSVGFVCLLGILLYFTTVITSLTRQNRAAIQRIGLLQARLSALESKWDDAHHEPESLDKGDGANSSIFERPHGSSLQGSRIP